jgi:L-fuculose-phosphate aldolase
MDTGIKAGNIQTAHRFARKVFDEGARRWRRSKSLGWAANIEGASPIVKPMNCENGRSECSQGGEIEAHLERHPASPAVLLGSHGLLAFAPDPLAAGQLVVAMGESAELTIRTRALGGERPLPAEALERERKHMQQFGSIG